MSKWSLKTKLFSVLGMLSIVAVVIAAVGITKMKGINASLNNIVEVTSVRQYLAAQLQQKLVAIHRAEKNFIIEEENAEMDKFAAQAAANEKELLELKEKLAKIVTEAGKKDIADFDRAFAEYKAAQQEVFEKSRRNTNLAAFQLSRGTGQELYAKAEGIMRSLSENSNALATKNIDELKKASTDQQVRDKLAQTDQATTRALLAAQALQDCLSVQRAEKDLILEQSEEKMKEYAKFIQTRREQLTKHLDDLAKVASAEEKRDLETFRQAIDAWFLNDQKVASLSLENSNSQAQALSKTKGRAAINAAEAALKNICDRSERLMAEDAERTDREYANARVMMIGAAVIGIGVAVVMGFLIIRSLVKALSRISDALAGGAEQTASAAGQVSASSQSLAQGASEQAAALEETSSSIEEMSTMTKKNAESAQQASTLSAETKAAADKGNTAMGRMANAINDIQKSAQETAKIIKVIDEIAFQTNLLALNAAVEAARAGEAGKGFAVVAEEVRNLAQRSAEAAKNTASMIEESVNNAKSGVSIAADVGKSLEEITAAATKVNGLVSEIAASSQEQSQGIQQVNTAVSQMDKVTQTNAANAEESAAASEELSSQAEQLNSLVKELIALVNGASAHGNLGSVHSPRQTHRQAAAAPGRDPTPKTFKPEDQIPLGDWKDDHAASEFSEFGKKAA